MSSRSLRRVAASFLAAGALVATTLSASSPSQAAAPAYVALGDSYSSGTGTRDYLDDGSDCLRSAQAYPSLIAAARGYDLNFRACSGAVIDDVTANQLTAVTGSTAYVTISIGGNDAGFADVITECALPAWAEDCAGRVAAAQTYIRDTLPGRLATLYSAIRAQAPSAQVTVVGYPRLFMGEDCNAATFFSPEDEQILNQTADLLRTVTSAQASAAGFSYADPIPSFAGHAVCDDVEWINGLSSPIVESYHPNTAGHRDGYTPLVSSRLIGSALTVTPAVQRQAAGQAGGLAAEQRTYAAADASIEPEVVRAPTPAQLRKLAAARGIDYDAWYARHAR